MPVHFIVAQAIVEHGMLDSVSSGLAGARYRLELYIGEGNTIYVLIGAAALLILFLFMRRRS